MNHAGKQIIVQKQPALDTETINAISAELQQAPVEHPAPGLARWRAEPQSPAVFDDWAERFGVDAANVPNGLRLADFRLLAIDMDSTLVTMETLDEIADMAGLKAEVAAITEAAMRGEIKDFSESLTRRMALLKGVGEDLIERVYQERLHLSPGAEILLAAAKAAGLKTMLISGGFTHFTERLKARLGFDYAFANQFDIANQRLTGRVLGPIVDGAFARAADADERVRDTVGVADALGDIVYVVYGMALELGIPLAEVLAEIQASNLSKLGSDGKPVYREDGKVLKGPDYFPPDIPKALGL